MLGLVFIYSFISKLPDHTKYTIEHLLSIYISIQNFESENKYNNRQQRATQRVSQLLGSVSQEVLLHPHRLLLLLHDSLFDDLDELLGPRPGIRLQAGVETGNALQLLLLCPAHPNKLLLRLHAQRQLPARTGNRKEAVLWW